MSANPGNLFSQAAPPRKARIEIIPLIDVIFFLLATVVLVTLSLNQTGGIRVPLPAVETHEERNPEGAGTSTVQTEGTLAWNKDPVSLNDFVNRLPAYKAAVKDPKIFVNGDKGARFTAVRYVIDEVRKAGINKVFVETQILNPQK
ncbi:MAG: biopolymer transporter ExbD [Opitutaceae bacterium]|jgi:biopolymer transport protein ExbD|nr:biopolymer transporter ExbD [Opitutaceae bacterium]